ncbi:ribbon-helix-helix domain-containing protein [Salinarimonas ramus]|uniref:Antitoxin FitA-like ribbon-helix-helix domain-containing protein n=1 Tax=Salinarimonas ramus TaxID=690164 RepID=A0A917V710_9HYPH|nr:CopG family transcriptional regulator [Salinarimonas ramus]GGK46303.1 hypothetical protein GCM10011322_36740 [Salinarimonas ramus]
MRAPRSSGRLGGSEGASMDILIRDLEDQVVARLETLARARGVTLEEIAREALRAFVQPPVSDFPAIAARIRAMGPFFPGSSVDLIREDRDNDEPYR